jgi:hypothetical protein
MVKTFIKSLFANRKRAIIIILQPPGETVRHYLTHDDEELFFLDKRESVATAARYILIRGFKFIHQNTDIHVHDHQRFEQDGVEYHLVSFETPVVSEVGIDGYQKLKDQGFTFVMIGDHPLAPKLIRALG